MNERSKFGLDHHIAHDTEDNSILLILRRTNAKDRTPRMPHDFIRLRPQGPVIESAVRLQAENNQVILMAAGKVDYAGRGLSREHMGAEWRVLPARQ